MTKDRVDYKPHLSLFSLSHISGTFIFNFRNEDLPRILGKGIIRTRRYLIQGSKETTACNFEKKKKKKKKKTTEPKDYFGEQGT